MCVGVGAFLPIVSKSTSDFAGGLALSNEMPSIVKLQS